MITTSVDNQLEHRLKTTQNVKTFDGGRIQASAHVPNACFKLCFICYFIPCPSFMSQWSLGEDGSWCMRMWFPTDSIGENRSQFFSYTCALLSVLSVTISHLFREEVIPKSFL